MSDARGLRRRRRRVTICLLIVSDYLAVLLSGLLASQMRFGSIFAPVAFENTPGRISFMEVSQFTALVWVVVIALNGLYDIDRTSFSSTEVGRVSRTLSVGVVALTLITYVLRTPGLSRAWLLLTWLLSLVLVLLARSLVSFLVVIMRRHGKMLYPTLVVGSNGESADLIRVLRGDADAGLVPVGCLTSSVAEKLELDYCSGDTEVLGSARDLLNVVQERSIDTVVIASSAFDHDVVARMLAELRDVDVDVHVSSGLFEVLTSRVLVNEIAGIPLITVKGVPLSWWNLFVKRVFDLSLSLAILVLGLPVWIILALSVKFTSSGPIFYGQERVGRRGRRFTMLKFRSMYVDADLRREQLLDSNDASGPLFKMKHDPRVTPLGRWMRKFSIDEFPQIMNVLKGEMSLVGPRPPLPEEVEFYTRSDWRRLEVTPGMTGLWQVSGRSSLTFNEMVRLDLFYIENWSVSLDLALVVRTIPAVLLARGAY